MKPHPVEVTGGRVVPAAKITSSSNPEMTVSVSSGGATQVAVAPTQVRRPWRSTARTIFQATVALALMWGTIVQALGLPDWAWVGTSVGVAGAITRVMALPRVEVFLRRFLPWLAAAPDPKP